MLLTRSFTTKANIINHVGPSKMEQKHMLEALDIDDLDTLIGKVIPHQYRLKRNLMLPRPRSEPMVIQDLTKIGRSNPQIKSLVGYGYHNIHVPPVLNQLFTNPAWYSAYSPYQSECSQGRLESLFNFQTLVTEITGLPVANASMLDDASTLSDAIRMTQAKGSKEVWISKHVSPNILNLIEERFSCNVYDTELDITSTMKKTVIYSWPDTRGNMMSTKGDYTIAVVDPLCLMINHPPPADIMLGNAQRLGVPLGYGGPHPAFMACTKEFERLIPGRMVLMSKTKSGEKCYQLGLQVREQHIRREKALSNICTSQALLANMVAMNALYNGYQGFRSKAIQCQIMAITLARALTKAGHVIKNNNYFDTLHVLLKGVNYKYVINRLKENEMEVRWLTHNQIIISLDETLTDNDVKTISLCLGGSVPVKANRKILKRKMMKQKIFNQYRTEHQLTRYMKSLTDKDYTLADGMIPLGSCTMKLNPACTLSFMTQVEYQNCHPFSSYKMKGYNKIFKDLYRDLKEITGYDHVILEPNSGSMGEYIALLTVDNYYQKKRRVCLIPESAHGTNPASAKLAGFDIVNVKCSRDGAIDVDHLQDMINTYKGKIGCLMVTWPSTYGLFDVNIKEIIDLIHKDGGQVYLDGANMNAMMGLARPGDIGADLGHLNLHKTFCIPHGGGGPGVGPVGFKSHLINYIPQHLVSSNGNAMVLPITWAYIRLMGSKGLEMCSKIAILNANYLMVKLKDHYQIKFMNNNNLVAHEFIIDLSHYKQYGITVEDIAKRLIDYGFHPPTMSWPVKDCLMIEPTESEDLKEMDKFIKAMLEIRDELKMVENGQYDVKNNPISNAPHSLKQLRADVWAYPYSREVAVGNPDKTLYPIDRVDNVHGDRNLIGSHII